VTHNNRKNNFDFLNICVILKK